MSKETNKQKPILHMNLTELRLQYHDDIKRYNNQTRIVESNIFKTIFKRDGQEELAKAIENAYYALKRKVPDLQEFSYLSLIHSFFFPSIQRLHNAHILSNRPIAELSNELFMVSIAQVSAENVKDFLNADEGSYPKQIHFFSVIPSPISIRLLSLYLVSQTEPLKKKLQQEYIGTTAAMMKILYDMMSDSEKQMIKDKYD